MGARDFYDINHEGKWLRLPRVTSIIGVIDKSRPLMHWAVKMERLAWLAALEEVCTRPGQLDPQQLYDLMVGLTGGKRAHVKASAEAADIGTAAHAIIRHHIAKMLTPDEDVGPEPGGPDAAVRAVVAWLDWAKEVEFTPLFAERIIYCPQCGYAGTLDCVAKVKRVLTLVDWKTGKAVYPESFLQNIAYRHAAKREGITTDAGLIVRLPKTAEDPKFEAVPVPPMPFGYFVSASRLWRWKQIMDGDESGPEMQKCEVQG